MHSLYCVVNLHIKKEGSQKHWKNFPVCITFCTRLINNHQLLGKINYRKLSTTGFLAHGYYPLFSSVYKWMSFSNNFDIYRKYIKQKEKCFIRFFPLIYIVVFPSHQKPTFEFDLICCDSV